jgi:hypothetical protein
MNLKKLLLGTIISFLSINTVFTQTAYDEDDSEVDYYVPGILANDAMSQVNFLLCFVESTNFSTFIDKGVYKALTDEAKCETASGADAASEAASATGSSAATGGGGGAANEVDATEYTSGIYQGTTSGNAVTGKGWVDIEIEGMDGSDVPTTAFLSINITADKSATNKFGSFTMRYDLRNTAANESAGFPLANLPVNQGYLSVDNTTIQYRETGMQGPDRVIVADLADANNIQGYMQTILRIVTGGGQSVYGVRHQVQVNEGADRYCQKFQSANAYTQSSGTWSEGSAISESDLASAITNAQGGGGYVDTDGGTAATITGEHCWNTSRTQAKRVIYEYGTYKNSDGSRADLTNPSMSLEANTIDNGGLSSPIWSHAAYWGVHVNPSDRTNVSDTTIFKNQRDKDDDSSYNLRKNYYEIIKKTRQLLPLNQLGGVSFQWYAGNFKDGGTFQTKLGNLGDGIPVSGSCNAAQGNCPEYSGNITVNEAGTAVTFTITHGMDWGNSIMPFALDTPKSFTAENWAASMSSSGWERRMHFWDPDSHQSYTIPFSAFGDVDASDPTDQARTRVEEKISIEQLETDIAAGGAGATGLMCIRECLDASNIDTAIAAAFTAVQNSTAPGALNVTPFKDVGDWWTVPVYYDAYVPTNDQNVGGASDEPDIAVGNYNNIGGIPVASAPTYTVEADGDVKRIRDVLDNAFLKYNTSNQTKVDARQHGDALQNYRYYMKPATYPNNWANNFGWAFHMTAVIDSNANKALLYCDTSGGNARGYDSKYRIKSNNNPAHATGTQAYYCDYKLWEGAVTTQYDIRLKQRPDYRLYRSSAGSTGLSNGFVNVSAPQTVVFTVPSSGVTYNFGASLAGKKFKLKFEGFGELHNLPGRVVNTCTGVVLGRYVNGGWNECYRYIHEFIIPDGTVLTNSSGGDDLKVRAIRGDEYLKKLDAIPSGVAYTKAASDLPAASTIQNLFSGDNAIGTVPATTLPSAGSDDPSVIHGKTVHTPPAN